MTGLLDRPVIYIGQCTQLNFISAVENFEAPIIGFASSYSKTQKFNCHKLLTQDVGVPVDLEDSKLDLRSTIKNLLEDKNKFKNVKEMRQKMQDSKGKSL